MKKLIALILILVITCFIVVSNDVPLRQKMDSRVNIEEKQQFISKNKNWEYVRNRLFDGETENVYRINGPILLVLDKASKQDSLAVGEIIKELTTIMPKITIAYFDNFTGMSYQNLTKRYISVNKNHTKVNFTESKKKIRGFPLWQLNQNSIHINFVDTLRLIAPPLNGLLLSNNYYQAEIARTIFNKNIEGFAPNQDRIYFDFDNSLPYERRKRNIKYEICRTLCYLNPSEDYFTDGNDWGVFKYSDYDPEEAKFNKFDKFLLQKLYSDDFIDQFKDYMYANYPWRYASRFINKEMNQFKVWGIITAVGVLTFGLIFSYFQDRKYKYSYLNYLFPIILILLCFINLINIYKYLTDFDSVIELDNDILHPLVLMILVAALISFLLWGLEKISFKSSKRFSYELILKVLFTFVSFVLPVVLLTLKSDIKWIKVNFVIYVFFAVGLVIGRGLWLYLNHFSASLIKEKDVQLSRLKEAKAEAEIKVLQSQINPHFLYNALNSIASLAHTDADKTEKMALSLSDLFRHSINRKGEKVNTLGDELSLVQNYLEIEQIRFGDRLDFRIDVETELLTVEIPMFILQPLVENAIKHGISKIEGQGKIVLKVSKKDNGIMISIQDNGPDFPEGLVSGHGLQTVYDLLKLSYGEKAEISWHNEPQKEISIHINTVL